MIIKFLKAAKGSAKANADYITQRLDHKGVERADVQVLVGDPHLTAAVANSLPYRQKFTAGVASATSEDGVTVEDWKEFINEFEKTFAPGLNPDQYSWSAVLHKDKDGGQHIHFLIANCVLDQNKSFNPAPPRHEYLFNHLRDYFNWSKGWSRPDDPKHARLLKPGYHAYLKAADVREGLRHEPDPKEFITNFLVAQFKAGGISGRDDIVKYLKDAGFGISRQGKDYLTVLNPDTQKKHRLKGVLYRDNVTKEDIQQAIDGHEGGWQGNNNLIDKKKAAAAYRKLEEYRGKRAEYNKKRYGIVRHPDLPATLKTEKQIKQEEKDRDEAGLYSGRYSISAGEVRTARVQFKTTLVLAFTESSPGIFVWKNRPTLRAFVDYGDQIIFKSKNPTAIKAGIQKAILNGWKTINVKSSDKKFVLDTYREARKQGFKREEITFKNSRYVPNPLELDAIEKELGYGINRNRKDFDRHTQSITDAAERNYKRAVRNNQRLRKSCGQLKQASVQLDRACEHLGSSLRRYQPDSLWRRGRAIMDNELTAFKEHINLVEYAVSRGFEVVAGKSSKSSTYLQNNNGVEIGISRHRSTGHDVFNDFTRGKGSGGTIIDFVQKIEGIQNLGEVRKKLRAYAGSPPLQIRYARPAPRLTPAEQKAALQSERYTMKPIEKSAYLESCGIPQGILQDPRFKGMIKTDWRDNVLFMHLNESGFSGTEKKNAGFTGFSKGGEKGIWACRPPADFRKIVFCESGIDALSHAVLYHDPHAAYVSLAGQISIEQEALIKRIIERNLERDPDFEFVAAFDNDDNGQRYASDLQRIAGEHPVSIEVPIKKDWNDDLRSAFAVEQQNNQI